MEEYVTHLKMRSWRLEKRLGPGDKTVRVGDGSGAVWALRAGELCGLGGSLLRMVPAVPPELALPVLGTLLVDVLSCCCGPCPAPGRVGGAGPFGMWGGSHIILRPIAYLLYRLEKVL